MMIAKKQRIIYKEDAAIKASELEEFMFGSRSEPMDVFKCAEHSGQDAVAELVKQAGRGGGLLHDADLFFEDTRGAVDSSDEEGGERRADQWREYDSGGDGVERVELEGRPGQEEGAAEARVLGLAGVGMATRQQRERAPTPQRAGAPRAPAWQDPHDAALRVDVAQQGRLRKLRSSDKQTTLEGGDYVAALRRQHEALNPRTGWARRRCTAAGRGESGGSPDGTLDDEEGGGGEAAALLGRAGGLAAPPGSGALPAGQLETSRLKDVNQHQPSAAVVQAVEFHPNGQLLLTAGLDRSLRLFQVDGVRNPLLQGVHLEDMPVTQAAFAGLGAGMGAADRVVLAGRRPFLYVYDMAAARVERVPGPPGSQMRSLETFAVAPPGCSPGSEPLVAVAGPGGFLPLLSLRNRQWVADLKMSGNVRSLAFTHDGRELFSTGDDGWVHVWDLRTRRCRLTFSDAGNICDASSLALSPDGRYVATGSRSGVVNVYLRGELEEQAARAGSGAVAAGPGAPRLAATPARELMNLTTDVDTLRFSPDSQMLAMSSRMRQNSLRLLHLPSLTVFANWPTSSSPLHFVHSLDFSPRCGLLAIGNAKGRALLYRLHHYQEA